MDTTNQKWWQTSEGSGAMSLRVKSLLVGFVPTIILIFGLLGHPINGDDVNNVITQVTNVIAVLGTGGAAFTFLMGFIRAFVNKKNNLGKYAPPPTPPQQ